MEQLDASLSDDCHHYEHISEVPWDIQKYWQQRYSIFSSYDQGIMMTDDAWFGVTPEPIAMRVAKDIADTVAPERSCIVDIFAGAGGNAIAFARSKRWGKVIAVEKDASVLACAKKNAEVYGVAHDITWVHADCFEYLPKAGLEPQETVVFASPPWGGTGYRGDEIFNLSTMQPYSHQKIWSLCKSMDCALYLPRTSDLRQLARLVPDGQKIDVVQYCMEGASKALVAYLPATAEISSTERTVT